MDLEEQIIQGTVTEVHGSKTLRTRPFRRDSDKFLYQLNENMHNAATIAQSNHAVLIALQQRKYISPRIYRKNDNNNHQYTLIDILGLPSHAMKMKEKLRITPHPFLEQIIEQHQIYHNDLAKSDPALRLNSDDPLNYIKESGLVCIPYSRHSEILNKTIQGLLVVSYDPKEKTINNEELRLLDQTSWFVADNVTHLLELDQFRKLSERLSLQTKIDGSTGLYNKKTFHEDIENLIEENNKKTKKQKYHLLLIDLDHFKSLNDKLGHAEGDKFIQNIGKYLITLPQCKSYRIGGDEFAIITTIEDKTQIYSKAQEILGYIKQIPLPTMTPHPTASIGILSYNPKFQTGDEWYRQTDKELYQAKRQRDNIIFSTNK